MKTMTGMGFVSLGVDQACGKSMPDVFNGHNHALNQEGLPALKWLGFDR